MRQTRVNYYDVNAIQPNDSLPAFTMTFIEITFKETGYSYEFVKAFNNSSPEMRNGNVAMMCFNVAYVSTKQMRFEEIILRGISQEYAPEPLFNRKELCEQYGARRVIVDKSAAGLIASLRAAGLEVSPSNGGITVFDGIKKCQNKIAAGELTIDPACENAIRELESYRWKEGRDEPVKKFRPLHGYDALCSDLPVQGRYRQG